LFFNSAQGSHTWKLWFLTFTNTCVVLQAFVEPIFSQYNRKLKVGYWNEINQQSIFNDTVVPAY